MMLTMMASLLLASLPFSFSGQPFEHEQVQPYSFTAGMWEGGGYNLIANPYPSDIEWNKIRRDAANDSAKTGASIFIWQPKNLQYGRYNGVSNVSILGVTNKIASSQSFFINAASTAGSIDAPSSLTIKENHKVSSGVGEMTGSFLRSAFEYQENAVQRRANALWVRAASSPFQGSCEGILWFQPGADQAATDPGDGIALGGNVNFFTMSDDEEKMDINIYPVFAFNWQVKIYMKVPTNTTYTVKIDSLSSFPAGSRFFLEDKQRPLPGGGTQDTIQDLLVDSVYTFFYEGPYSANTTRFLLHCIAPNVAVKPIMPGTAASPLDAFLFPNPASSVLTVKLTNARDKACYRVISSTGAQVMGGKAEGSSFNLNVEHLAKGIYLVRVEENGRSVTKRFVKE